MRNETHDDFIVRWAKFVKNNPKKWKKFHTYFINAQIKMNRNLLKRLSKQKDGPEKIIKLYDIKNINGYKKLLKIKLISNIIYFYLISFVFSLDLLSLQ